MSKEQFPHFDMHYQFNNIDREVEFSTAWYNGTGYLNGAVHADLGLKPGERAKTTDTKGRWVILVGTRFGNAVFFERYSPKEDGTRSASVVCNIPDELRAFCPTSSVSSDELARMASKLGNIGQDIEDLIEAAKRQEARV